MLSAVRISFFELAFQRESGGRSSKQGGVGKRRIGPGQRFFSLILDFQEIHQVSDDLFRLNGERRIVLPDHFQKLIAELRLALFLVIAFDTCERIGDQFGQMKRQREGTFLGIQLIFLHLKAVGDPAQPFLQRVRDHAFINSMYQLEIRHPFYPFVLFWLPCYLSNIAYYPRQSPPAASSLCLRLPDRRGCRPGSGRHRPISHLSVPG